MFTEPNRGSPSLDSRASRRPRILAIGPWEGTRADDSIRLMTESPRRLPLARRRARRLSRLTDPHPGPVARRAGRAWINGREVGGVDPRFAHLAASYD